MSITIPTRRLFWLALALTVFFVIVGGLGDYSEYFMDDDPLRPLRAFNFSRGNLPTWFSSVAYLAGSVLLGMITLHHWPANRTNALPWGLLAVMFLALSANEMFAVEHNTLLGYAVRLVRSVTGLGYTTSQVVIAVLAGVMLAPIYIRFLLMLPPTTRRGFVLAGIVFFGGAIGLESIGMIIYRETGGPSLPYLLAANLEEFSEIAGVLIFLYALSDYILHEIGNVTMQISEA